MTGTGTDLSEVARRAVHDVVRHRRVRSVFQPLLNLDTMRTVGYEALSRGPEGHRLESPMALLEAARSSGDLAELDWACRSAALATARRAGLDPGLSWFVNVEPQTLTSPCPRDLRPVLDEAHEALQVVMEFTERDLVRDPAALLGSVRGARAGGRGVALDDVGAHPASLALLPFVDPDVIKLDMRLVQRHMDREVAAVSNAVRAHAESSGAVILAEGIEDDHDVLVARTMGATLGQGWLFGRPGPLPRSVPTVLDPLPRVTDAHATESRTPFEVVAAAKPTAVTEKRLLRPISRHLEDQSTVGATAGVLLACFQRRDFFTGPIARRYQRLARDTAFTAALGQGLEEQPAPGVRGTALHPADRLVGEWNVLVVGAHYAGALVARDLGDSGPDQERRFAYAVTHHRPLVVEAARALLHWVAPTR